MHNRYRRSYFILLSALAGLLLWTGLALAQGSSSFRMEKSVIGGGSGAMSSSSFALQGTTGQHDVGTGLASSGSFELRGGFWPDATPTPTLPPTSTPVPTASPTVEPTVEPEISPSPIASPVASPTPSSTPSPTPEAEGEDEMPPSLFLPALEGH